MDSSMMGSNVWDDSPLSEEANSTSVLYTNTNSESISNSAAYKNPYVTSYTGQESDSLENDNVDNNNNQKEFGSADHNWGEIHSHSQQAHDSHEKEYNNHVSAHDDNNNNFVDEFKIQNELAQTMKSILLNDDDDELHADDSDNASENDQTEHVHYIDNNTHRKSDVGNPFLASSAGNDDNVDTLSRVNIDLLKEKKDKLISSLTRESTSHGFLKDDTDTNDVNPDNLFSFSPVKSSKAENGGIVDSPLDGLLNLANTTSKQKSNLNDNVDRPSRYKGIVSPNRKIKILRPRRVTKSSLIVEQSTSLTDSSPFNGDSSLAPVDPLSAPLSDVDGKKDTSLLVSPSSRKQKFINESEAPLFNVNRDQVLQQNRQQLSPITSSKSNQNSESFKYMPIDEDSTKFDIAVGDPLKVGELTNAHVVYTINTKSKCDLLNHEDTVVTRRYSDFLWLYHQLLNNHPGYIIPPPPEKQVYGRFDNKFIENRRHALENMLNKIAERTVLQTDPDFIIFLQSENFAQESKEREIVVHHNANIESLTVTDQESTIEGPMNTMAQILNTSAGLGINEPSSSGGFFSSLIGLNAPKYIEQDTFILEQQAYIDSLDNQLRQLTNSLDMILEKREELTLSLQEVTVVIQQLADLEVNVEITNILSNFEELQSKVRELLERGNLSQILTFGSTVDEYVRLIGSVRNCFENRLKICNSIATLQQHQEKKEQSLAKFRSKNQNQLDKIGRFEDELSKVNNVLDRQLQFKDDFDKNFKSELSRFEFYKIKDFKNMVEIYWESLIENQKLLIELWESFYDKCKFDD